MYGLPKIHREGAPLRPIVNTIGAPTYSSAQYLATQLGEYVGNSPRHVKDFTEFINIIKSLRAGPEGILFSFDVVSLFTMVPIVVAPRLLSRQFDEDILRLFHHVLTSPFNRQFYEQTDGVAMGSPLFPVIADFFMEHFEETALEGETHRSFCWIRYVDDTFIWPNGPGKLSEFLDHLKSIHESIQFTMGMERNGIIPSLMLTFTANLMAYWAIRFSANPRTPTSTSIPTLTTTLQIKKLYSPHWCTGPVPVAW
jgi:hypothetical protein